MYQRTEDEFNPNARYYASPQEQKILIQGLQQYFSLPERSQNRNKIAKNVSMYLRSFSPHWTHRAVRLWFNNNKHTYLATIPGVSNVIEGPNFQDGKVLTNSQIVPPPNFAVNQNLLAQPQMVPPQNFAVNQNLLAQPQMIPQTIQPMPPVMPNPTIINQLNYQSLIPGQMMPSYQYPPIPSYQMPPPPPLIPSYIPPVNPPPPPPVPQQMMNQPAIQPIKTQQFTNPQKSKIGMKNEATTQIILPPISIASAVAAQQQPQTSGTLSLSPLKSNDSLTKVSVTSPKSIHINTNQTTNSKSTHKPEFWKQITESQEPQTTNQPNSKEGTQTNRSDLQNYSNLLPIINQIREIDQIYINNNEQIGNKDLRERFLHLVTSFDQTLFQMLSQYGFVIPERIEPSLRYIQFLFPLDTCTPSFSLLRSMSRLDIDNSTSMTTFTNDQSIGSLFPYSYSNFDLYSPSPSPSFMQLQQIANDPSYSALNTNASSTTQNSTTNSNGNKTDDHAMVHSNSNSGSDDNDGNTGKEEENGPRHTLYGKISPPNIFQSRTYVEEKLTYFDSCSMNDQYAVYTSTTLGATQRNMYVLNYKEKMKYMAAHPEEPYENSKGRFLNIHMVESTTPIDSIALDHRNIWMVSKRNVIKYELTQMSVPQITISLTENKVINPLDARPTNDRNSEDGFITVFNKTKIESHNGNMNAVVGYPSSETLYIINENSINYNESSDYVIKLATPYSGFVNVATLHNENDRLLCAVTNSSCIRLINPHYSMLEERVFVGHCGQVRGMEPISDSVFISRADDQTVRIWDIRERCSGPVSTITTPQVSPISLSGDDFYVVCGFHNKYIGVVDLRMDGGTPVLGVNTQDYDAIALRYRQDNDSLAMIGMQEKDSNKDSLMFVDPNKKCVFRYYSKFIGFDTD